MSPTTEQDDQQAVEQGRWGRMERHVRIFLALLLGLGLTLACIFAMLNNPF